MITLSDLVRYSGARLRSLQFWTERGLLISDQNFPGRGNHRHYAEQEVVMARLLLELSNLSISGRKLEDIAKAFRTGVLENKKVFKKIDSGLQHWMVCDDLGPLIVKNFHTAVLQSHGAAIVIDLSNLFVFTLKETTEAE